MLPLLLACTGPGGTGSVPTGTDEGDLDALTIVASEVVPSVFQLSWETPAPGTSWVEYGLASPSEASTPEVASATSRHAVALVGLKNNRAYHWKARTRLADGTVLESGVNELVVPPVPPELPRLDLETSTPEATVAGGFLVTTLIEGDGGWAVIVDGDGDVVWWYDTGHQGAPPADLAAFAPGWDGFSLPVTSRLDPSTRSLVVQFYDGHQVDDVATLRRIPLDAMLEASVVTTRTVLGHHDFVVDTAGGTVGWLAYQTRELDGRTWASDVILETAEGDLGASPRPVWSWFGDYGEDPYLFDELQSEFAVDSLAELEWTHSNSLMFDPGEDAYFVMSKFLDCLVKVDRTTSETAWTMGGQFSDFRLPGGGAVWTDLYTTALWSHAHMSHLWTDPAAGTGGFVVFDNGYYYPAKSGVGYGWSRAAELAWDEEARTVEKVWEYVEPDGAFTPLMGDVRKLDGGSYLVGWSSLGRVDEIAPDGTVRWRLQTGLGSIVGRVSWYERL